jgi:hypothetical protein
MKINIIILNLLMVPVLLACGKRDNSEFTDTPIIESYLRPGDDFNLKVSRQIPFTPDVRYSEDDIDSLLIKVTNNDNTYILTPAGEGKYIDSSLVVREGETYDLSFTFNLRNVMAYTHIPIKPENFDQSDLSMSIDRMNSTSGPPSGGPGEMPEPVSLTWKNDDDSYYIVVIENMEATLDPIRDFGDNGPPGTIFKKPPTTSSGLQLRPQEFQYFGKHRLILYHVLPDYASLYSENSTSSQNLTNPSTSIMNGYGIFTGLNSDTLYFTVNEN